MLTNIQMKKKSFLFSNTNDRKMHVRLKKRRRKKDEKRIIESDIFPSIIRKIQRIVSKVQMKEQTLSRCK